MTHPAGGSPTLAPLILVADDEVDLAALVRHQLERMHYRVVSAKDGEEALHLAREHRPALAVLDIMMPRMNGYEVVQAMRTYAETESIPVILLSARQGGLDAQFGLRVGAQRYICKPFKADALRAAVEELLEPRDEFV